MTVLPRQQWWIKQEIQIAWERLSLPRTQCQTEQGASDAAAAGPFRDGATVLKVGGDKLCERSEQKIFFDPPTFWPVGGQNIAYIDKSASLVRLLFLAYS